MIIFDPHVKTIIFYKYINCHYIVAYWKKNILSHTNKNVAGILFVFHSEGQKNVQSNDHIGAFDPKSFQISKPHTKLGL